MTAPLFFGANTKAQPTNRPQGIMALNDKADRRLAIKVAAERHRRRILIPQLPS